jgi:hypothetical protein
VTSLNAQRAADLPDPHKHWAESALPCKLNNEQGKLPPAKQVFSGRWSVDYLYQGDFNSDGLKHRY